MEALVSLLNKHHLSISSVESFTVGMFASELGSIPGVSSVYRGSLVTYQTVAKQTLLGIDANVIEEFGVVSKEVALLMIQKGNELLNTDICVSFTGNAGPGVMEDKDVGEVYIGISFCKHEEVYALKFEGSRTEIQKSAINFVIHTLHDKIKEM